LWLVGGWLGDYLTGLREWLAQGLPGWLQWLATGAYWLAWLSFGLGGIITVFFTFSLVANLVGAPFNGFLAERVEQQLTGRKPDSGRSLWAEMAHLPSQELRKLAYFVLLAIPALLLNFLLPIIWPIFSAWMLCLQYADYPLGNQGMAFRQQRRLMGRHRGTAMGFGFTVLLMTIVPGLNFLAMPAAVVGATLMWLEELRPAV
jgi:CysZ protein